MIGTSFMPSLFIYTFYPTATLYCLGDSPIRLLLPISFRTYLVTAFIAPCFLDVSLYLFHGFYHDTPKAIYCGLIHN